MKVLLKHKIKSVLPVLAFGGLITIAAVLLMSIEIYEINPYEIEFGTFFMDRVSSNLTIIPLILVPVAVSLGIILTQEYGDREKEDFLSAIPIKSGQRFMACILPGVIFFIVFGIALLIAVIVNYEISYDYYSEINMMSPYYEIISKMDGVGNAILHIVQITLSMLMIFFITVFASVSARNKMISVIVLAAICAFPIYIPEAVNNITTGYFNIKMPLHDEITNCASIGAMIEEGSYIYVGEIPCTYFEYSTGKTIVSGGLLLIFAILSYLYAVKLDRLNGKIMVNKTAEVIFIITAGVYGACIIPTFRNMENMKFGILAVTMCIVFAVIEIVLYRFITGKGRYSYLNAGGEKV